MMWSARLPQTAGRRSININQIIMLDLITKKKDKKLTKIIENINKNNLLQKNGSNYMYTYVQNNYSASLL